MGLPLLLVPLRLVAGWLLLPVYPPFFTLPLLALFVLPALLI